VANKIEIVITAKDQASGTIQGIGDSFAGMGKKIAAAAGGLIAALGLAKLTQAMGSYVTGATQAAARSSELAAVLDLLGARAGWTAEMIDTNVQAMMDLGIRSDVARDTLAQFARNQLDAADATMAARVAQDLAVLSARDSSETLSELIYAIRTQNSSLQVMRDLGIQTGAALETFAASLGKTTKELTAAERQQAMLNAVQEAGIAIAGTYATAMEEPGKRMRSLARHFYEIQQAIGSAFLPAFGNVITLLEG
jgi:hypothetical protein